MLFKYPNKLPTKGTVQMLGSYYTQKGKSVGINYI